MANGNQSGVIRVNKSTIIQFSIFNFFAPIAIVPIFVSCFELYSFASTMFGFLSIVIGLFCLISNLIKYGRYINVSDDSVMICSGSAKKYRVLELIRRSELQNMQLEPDFSIKYRGRKINLLQFSPSILGLICWIGPLVFIPILQRNNIAVEKKDEIKELIPEIILPEISKQQISKVTKFAVDVLMWGFVVLIMVIGCFGILAMPFYALMR